jgi:cardiolipin synthase
VAAADARARVEAVLGRRPERRPLSINFAPATATSWELLIDGPAFFPRILADIEAARSDVHVIIFGFKPGEIGNRFRDVMVRKAGEGVHVRLVVEGGYSQPRLGSWRGLYAALHEAGVEIVANQGLMLDLDGPIGRRRIDWRFDDLGHFDHRKLVVIDGRVAFVGGPGIEDHYADDRFHDVMLRLEGPIVAQLQALFLLSWQFRWAAARHGRRARPVLPPPPSGDGVPMEILHNNPGERHLPIAPAFLEAIAARPDGCTSSTPTSPTARSSGASSRLPGAASTPGHRPGRSAVVPGPGRRPALVPALHDAGVDVREHPRMAHAKVVLATTRSSPAPPTRCPEPAPELGAAAADPRCRARRPLRPRAVRSRPEIAVAARPPTGRRERRSTRRCRRSRPCSRAATSPGTAPPAR